MRSGSKQVTSKLTVLGAAGILWLTLGHEAVGPALALRALRSALMSGDVESIRNRVDFTSLQESVVNAAAAQDFSRITPGGIDPVLLSGADGTKWPSALALKLRSVFTPEGFAKISEYWARSAGPGLNNPLDDVSLRYVSPKRFEVDVHAWVVGGRTPALVFDRTGLSSWTLTGIQLPRGWLVDYLLANQSE